MTWYPPNPDLQERLYREARERQATPDANAVAAHKLQASLIEIVAAIEDETQAARGLMRRDVLALAKRLQAAVKKP